MTITDTMVYAVHLTGRPARTGDGTARLANPAVHQRRLDLSDRARSS